MNRLHRSSFIVVAVVVSATLCLSGCQQSDQSQRIAELQTELEGFQAQLKKLKAEWPQQQSTAEPSKQLVHVVWFELKDGADTKALIAEVKKLKAIPGVNGLQFGQFQDLGDKRAMSQLEFVMQMSFNAKADYDSYQAHDIHQQLKKDIGQFIAAPPVTYDYWTE